MGRARIADVLLAVSTYGPIDWKVMYLARCRYKGLTDGEAYMRYMEDREQAGQGALRKVSRHEGARHPQSDVRNTKRRDVFDKFWYYESWIGLDYYVESPPKFTRPLLGKPGPDSYTVTRKHVYVNHALWTKISREHYPELSDQAFRNQTARELREMRRQRALAIREGTT